MHAPDPIAFTIFGIDIRWYGVLISFGAMLGLFIAYRRAAKCGVNGDDVLDVTIWSLPIGIIGARVYYIIFNWDLYAGNLYEMLDIREGGLAIHGGLIFGIVTAYLVCRHKKISFLNMADLMIPSVALAQAIGRWGNFFNGEAHGGPTNLPWGIIVDGQRVHPTFLYESIWCLILFFVLLHIAKHRRFKGQILCLYGMGYSFERFFVEALRTDSLMIGPFKQAQVISVCIFIASILLYIFFKNRGKTTK